ncbi:MAG: ATP-binding protein [Proteobacteria bacterium]|nr:ATP-binding protein [Pseudomonadota bacterium]
MSRHISLITRVVVVLFSAAIVPTVFVGYLAIRNAENDVEREVVRGNLALIRALGASLDDRLQGARRAIELAAAAWADHRPAVVASEVRMGEKLPARVRSSAERLLDRLRQELPLVSTISITDEDGRVVYGHPRPPEIGTGKDTYGGYISDIFFENGRPKIGMVVRVSNRTGALVAVFVARLDLEFVSQALRALVEESRLGHGARLWVVDGHGRPVARSDGVPISAAPVLRNAHPAVDRALQSTGEGSVESDGILAVYSNIADYQSVRAVRWAIILDQPAEYAYALARKTRRDTIFTGVVVLALSLFLGVALATRLTGPLHQLAERADAIAGNGAPGMQAGDAPAAPVDAPGEIGQLALRIEEMARRIGEREKLLAALARGDRLASVGTMAASLAHEINNPLTTIMGYAKYLLEGKEEDHPDRMGLELIAEEAERMKGIVGNLLDYSRSDRATGPALGVADVNAIVRHTADLLVPQLRRSGVHLDMKLQENLPDVASSPYALQQVFVNLVQNAAQAMPEGGTATISSRTAPGSIAVEVTVTDEGPGVPEQLHSRIFDPFVTSKEAGAGTGLGLAVCKHLIASAGGSIGVTSGPNRRGACFRVVIPIADPGANNPATHGEGQETQ